MKPCTCSAYPFPHRPGSGRCQFDDAAALMREMYRYELSLAEYVENDQENWRETVHEIACLNELAPTDRYWQIQYADLF